MVEAIDRQGLLRDVTELLAKEKMNVRAVNTQTVRTPTGGNARMMVTVEVGDTARLGKVLEQVGPDCRRSLLPETLNLAMYTARLQYRRVAQLVRAPP